MMMMMMMMMVMMMMMMMKVMMRSYLGLAVDGVVGEVGVTAAEVPGRVLVRAEAHQALPRYPKFCDSLHCITRFSRPHYVILMDNIPFREVGGTAVGKSRACRAGRASSHYVTTQPNQVHITIHNKLMLFWVRS
jgi:hypothetical protein